MKIGLTILVNVAKQVALVENIKDEIVYEN